MMSTPPKCRLFGIFARTTHQAVIFRRGPRLWTQFILWDTATDTFIEGQWFKGTLYFERCDLSPDASMLVYFAAKHYKGFKPNSANLNNWTAICRPPYFTALARWTSSDTWNGGGYFEDDKTIYIAERVEEGEYASPPSGIEVHSLFTKYDISTGNSIFHDLLIEKRGWVRTKGDFSWDFNQRRRIHPLVVWHKTNIDRSYTLLWQMSLAEFPYKHDFKLRRHQDNAEFEIDSHEWADWDQRGRLIYTKAGALFTAIPRSHHLESIQIADFTANKPKLIQSPPWARTWDQPRG